jgi:hypothetical protein
MCSGDWEEEDIDILKCPYCNFEGPLEDFDVLGACPGNLFCNMCGCEVDFNSDPPKVALLCGNCQSCRELMLEGIFGTTQDNRLLLRRVVGENKPKVVPGEATVWPEDVPFKSDAIWECPVCKMRAKSKFRPVCSKCNYTVQMEFVRILHDG